jgi:hypothetical protein
MALIGKVAARELRDGSLVGAVREPPPCNQRVHTQLPLIEAKTGGFACNGRSHLILLLNGQFKTGSRIRKGACPRQTGQICLAFPL